MTQEITRRERGWGGHFIAAHDCLFRRNTLVSDEVQSRHIVVSTVGNYDPPPIGSLVAHGDGPQEIGYARHYETMCFVAVDDAYRDADFSKHVDFGDEPWSLRWTVGAVAIDNQADAMHEGVVLAVMRDFHRMWEAAVDEAES